MIRCQTLAVSVLLVLVFAALLAVPTVTAGEMPSGGPLPIVAKSIAFHGGDLYDHAEIAFTIVSKSGAFDARVRQDGGTYRHAVTSETDAGRRTVIATNDGVTVLLDGEPQPVPADRAQRLRDFVSARIYFPLLPYRLADPSVHQEDLGIETLAGGWARQGRRGRGPPAAQGQGDLRRRLLDRRPGRVPLLVRPARVAGRLDGSSVLQELGR